MLKKSPVRRVLSVLALLPILMFLGVMLRWPLSWTDQAYLSGLVIASSVIVGSFSASRSATLTLTMLSVFCTLRYGIWRWTSSVTYLQNSGWHVDWIGLFFAFLLLGAETYAIFILLLGYYQSARPLQRQPVSLPSDTSVWPSVDVYIPTYNEPLDVVRPTVLAALGIDWPQDRLHVHILDDGKRSAFRDFAEECGVGYITRLHNSHAKAGNINNALKVTKSEYIAIFDCDHIATRSFLQVTMGWFFKDSRLAMVQTPHHFYSPDPFERNLRVFRKVPNEGALFYGVVQDGNDLWNATFFCGSCAVMRRDALEEVGGIAVETVTEDAHTALRLQRRGWNTAYLGIPQAAGLATGSLSAHVGQRIRWARGMVQILRTECPLFVSGLRFSQRLCYLNCVIHYLYAIPRLIFVSAPLVYLIFGISNLYGYIWEIFAYAAPHLVLSNIVNSRTQGNHRHSFWNEMYEMVLAPYILLPTTFALINPKWGKFNVTAKSSVVEDDFFDWKIARPYILLLCLNFVGIAMATVRYLDGNHAGVLIVNVVWALLNSLLLGASVAVSFETKQRRSHVRVEAALTATLLLPDGESHHCRVLDLSEGGLSLRSERALNIDSGQELVAILRAGDDAHGFPVETVRTQDNRLHMRFIGSDIKTQTALTKLVYARADSWLDWTKDQKRDRILGSMLTIFGIGAHGLWLLPSMFIKRERKQESSKQQSVLAPAIRKAALPALLLLLVGSSLLQAKQASSGSGEQPTTNGNSRSFKEIDTLRDLGGKGPLLFRGASAESQLSFVLPGTKIVDSASLTMRYQMANVPAGAQAILNITLNDVEVGTAPLGRTPPETSASQVELPADLLVHDNHLRFRMSVQCTTACTETALSAVSLRIEPTTTLTMSGLAMALPNRLSILPSPFFDPSTNSPVQLRLAFADVPDVPTMQAAGIVASWMGALADYRGSHASVSIGQIPTGNAIVFATSQSVIAAQLGLSGSPSSVVLCDNPSDPYGKVLALIGNSSADLVPLAQALALKRVQSETGRLELSQISVPQDVPTNAARHLDAVQEIDIAGQLNESLLHVALNAPSKVYFRIAPDLDFGARESVPLALRFRFKGLRGANDAALLIDLNGISVAQRKLRPGDSSQEVTESFAIPVSLLYPSNTLTIHLVPNHSDIRSAELASLEVQIRPHSYLDLRNARHFTRMPRLDLFAASGFPFTERSDLSTTTFLVPPTPTPAQLGTFFDGVSFLAAQTGTPALHLHISQTPDASASSSRNLIVVGSASNESLFQPFAHQMILTPASNDFVAGNFSLSWTEWLDRPWMGRSGQRKRLADYLESETPPLFLMEEFANPRDSSGTVLVLATKSELDDDDYFSRLGVAANQGDVHNGLVLADEKRFRSFAIASHSYTLGEKKSLTFFYSWMTFHLWLIPLLLLGAGFVVARRWELYLEQQAVNRLSGGTTLREISHEA